MLIIRLKAKLNWLYYNILILDISILIERRNNFNDIGENKSKMKISKKTRDNVGRSSRNHKISPSKDYFQDNETLKQINSQLVQEIKQIQELHETKKK